MTWIASVRSWWDKRSRLRAVLRWGVGLFTVGLLVIGFVNAYVIYSAQVDIFERVEDTPRAQTAIIFGSAVYRDGTLVTVTNDRVQTGIALYKQGIVRKILISGDHGRTTYDEVNPMYEAALKAGVPPEDVFMDHAGFSTYDTVARAKRVFDVGTVVLVTQRFHLPRALMIARAHGLSAVGIVADRHRYAKRLRMNLRELLARPKDFVKVLFLPPPTCLGPAIPIVGDGRVTRDHLTRRRTTPR